MIENPESPLPPSWAGKEAPLVDTSCIAATESQLKAMRPETSKQNNQFLIEALME
jgi:hypothetical protein